MRDNPGWSILVNCHLNRISFLCCRILVNPLTRTFRSRTTSLSSTLGRWLSSSLKYLIFRPPCQVGVSKLESLMVNVMHADEPLVRKSASLSTTTPRTLKFPCEEQAVAMSTTSPEAMSFVDGKSLSYTPCKLRMEISQTNSENMYLFFVNVHPS